MVQCRMINSIQLQKLLYALHDIIMAIKISVSLFYVTSIRKKLSYENILKII